jgi:iron complex transport system substrate-binding protein
MSTIITPLDHPATDAEFARIIDELSRRGFLAGGLGTAALLGLAACSSSGTGADAGGSSSSSAGPSTRQVTTAKGPVTVPADPKRVISIQPSATATLYDVGIASIGVYDEGSQYISPRYRTKWEAAATVGTGGEIDVEKVAALSPDLIIGFDYDWNTKAYSQLTELAPTVIAPATTWQAGAHTVADAVNRLGKLDTLIQQLTIRSAQIKHTYATQLAAYKWDLLQGGFEEGQYWLYGPNTDCGSILAAAGVRFASGSVDAASSQSPGRGVRALSYEKIDLLADSGVIGFYANYDNTPNNEAPALFAQQGFKDLAAVKAGRLVPFPDFLPGGYGDALAVLDELETGLKKL